MTKFKIVLVPFPFDNLSSSKVRPAVCLTNSLTQHNHVIIAFITSKTVVNLEETDILLETGSPNFVKTGLKVSSVIRLHRLVTISTIYFQRELGLLSKTHQLEVNHKLRKLFDLS